MADKKITALNPNTTPLITDLMVLEDDPAGSAETQAIRPDNLFKVINGFTELAVAETAANDEIALYDATASAIKKITIATLFRHYKRNVQIPVFEWVTNTVTGDGKYYFFVPADLNGLNLTSVRGTLITAGTTGQCDIQIYNVTTAADMLSTKLVFATGATLDDGNVVIDAGQDDVTTDDVLRFDCDAVHTTPAKGMIVHLGFS